MDSEDSYEIEQLLSRRVNLITKKTQHLVKWAQYPASDNAWYNVEDLGHARDLVKECDERIREGELTLKDRRRPWRLPKLLRKHTIATRHTAAKQEEAPQSSTTPPSASTSRSESEEGAVAAPQEDQAKERRSSWISRLKGKRKDAEITGKPVDGIPSPAQKETKKTDKPVDGIPSSAQRTQEETSKQEEANGQGQRSVVRRLQAVVIPTRPTTQKQ